MVFIYHPVFILIYEVIVLNVEDELKLYGFTPESYEEFLQDCGDKINGTNNMDWSEILDKYGLPFNIRRISESMGRNILGGIFVREFYKDKMVAQTPEDVAKELKEQEYNIYKAKRKLQDERNALNKLLRDEARYEENLRILEDRLEKIGKERYPLLYPSSSTSIQNGTDENVMICMLSDLHVGLTYSSEKGRYDGDVAKKRLAQYIYEIKKVAERHHIEKCVVCLAGDMISGSIHLTLQITNRENIVEQIMLSCEMIADFIYKLMEFIPVIEVYSVPGNHSRIEKNKDDNLLGEKLDNLVPWFLDHIFADKQNLYVGIDEMTDTYSSFIVKGKEYLLIHGDYDGLSDTAIQKLCAYIGRFPYAVLMGHKHHIAMNDVSGVKVIQCGSLCGSGDEYCVKNRLAGQPSQTVMVCNKKGIEAIYPIELT